MLAGPGDSHGDIHFRCDSLACEPNLVARGDPARVHCRSRSAHGAAQQFGQSFQGFKRLGSAQTSPTGDHDAGILQLHSLGRFFHDVDNLATGLRGVQFHRERHNLALS